MQSIRFSESTIGKLAISLSIASALFLAGCTKRGNNPVSSQQQSVVQGEVNGQQGLAKSGELAGRNGVRSVDASSSGSIGVQGATIALAEIQVDGSLKTVSTAPVTTDAQGRFSVKTNLDGVGDLVAVATQGTSQWEAIVSSEVRNGETVNCQPLTDQTTVQSQAYSKIVADGKGTEVTPADLQLFITPLVAANVMGNSNAIAQLASALEAEAGAQATAFSQFNITEAQIQSAATARQQAQASFESAMYAADGDSAADNVALQTYYAATVGAYVSAGIPIQTLAEVEDASCSALTNNTQSLSAGINFSVEQSSALVRAALAGQAVLAEMQAGGATQAEISSTDSANASLLANLNMAVSSTEISSAFESYHSAIVTQLLDMDSSDSSTVSGADAQIEAAGGAGSVLKAALNSASTTGAIVQAYMTFYGAVSTMMSGMGGMTTSQLDASTQILMILDSNS